MSLVLKKCKNCKKDFHYYSTSGGKGAGKYCSLNCRWKFSRGKNHPRWVGGQAVCICRKCGKNFLAYTGINKGFFCSINCGASYRKGELGPNWKGGVTPVNKIIRMSSKYENWRHNVFERDNYACVWGGEKHGNKLQADHIKPFSIFIELRLDINNGQTLCIKCHKIKTIKDKQKYKLPLVKKAEM